MHPINNERLFEKTLNLTKNHTIDKVEVSNEKETKQVSSLSDYFKSFERICNSNGFAVESHQIETADGYLLETFRIQPQQTK